MLKRTIYLDKFIDKQELHKYIAESLDFPEYYGKNLDALYDLLCCIHKDMEIYLLSDIEDDYVINIVNVFIDAAKENSHLSLKLDRSYAK